MHVTADSEAKSNKLAYSFYPTGPPYAQLDKVKLAREHFQSAMIVKDYRPSVEPNETSFYTALYTGTNH